MDGPSIYRHALACGLELLNRRDKERDDGAIVHSLKAVLGGRYGFRKHLLDLLGDDARAAAFGVLKRVEIAGNSVELVQCAFDRNEVGLEACVWLAAALASRTSESF